jgi:hypothetical protein
MPDTTAPTGTQEAIAARVAALIAEIDAVAGDDRALLDAARQRVVDAGHFVTAWFGMRTGQLAGAAHDAKHAADNAPVDPTALGQ